MNHVVDGCPGDNVKVSVPDHPVGEVELTFYSDGDLVIRIDGTEKIVLTYADIVDQHVGLTVRPRYW